MGFPCALHISTKIPKPIKIQNLIAHLIKLLNFTRQTSSFNNESRENRPCPLLVPLPIYTSSFGSELFLKNLLPTIEFGNFLEKRGTQMEEKWEECAICLNKLEYSDKVRELVNCSHVFHYICLDKWVGKGQVTCPLCREDLVANFIEEGGGDPWRVQRIVYLFGEDFVNSNF